jgi:hypothetical protein
VKLDPVKVEWIIRQKEKGTRNAQIKCREGIGEKGPEAILCLISG